MLISTAEFSKIKNINVSPTKLSRYNEITATKQVIDKESNSKQIKTIIMLLRNSSTPEKPTKKKKALNVNKFNINYLSYKKIKN